MATRTVAGLVVDTLARAGVGRIYGVSGDSLNGITDSIRRHERMRWIHVRHEETAAFAAGADAHLTGRLAVCAGSCGPGNLHLINGLYDCHRSRVPVLAIAAHIPSPEIGSGYFQETHPEHLFAQCSDYCEMVSQPEQMPRVLEIAMQTAISRRGVSVIVLPGDIALRDAVEDRARPLFPEPRPHVCPSEDEIAALAKTLNEAKRITILGGAGCAGAHAELIETARKLNAPIVHAMRGKEFIEYDNPFDVGMTGLLGFSSGYHAMMSCDVLLMLGTDFPYRQFFPTDARIVQIDIRGEQLGRRTRVDQGLGAQVSHPGRQVVALSGDGGLAMLMGDLLSLRQLQLPVKVIVFKNDALAFVELEMKAAGILEFGTDLHNPDFAKMAEAAGVLGLTAETADQVRPMMARALEHDGPALLEVLVHRQELAMPPRISLEQITGFSLFMLKTVLSGRGDQLIDLAKINLFR